jgi:hypothetical protein
VAAKIASEDIRMDRNASEAEIVWRTSSGEILSCAEKLKVLRENLHEIEQICQDAFEDALLMGCDEQQVRTVFLDIVQALKNPYMRG